MGKSSLDKLKRRDKILVFVRRDFDTIIEYVTSISKEGIIEELLIFDVILPKTRISTECAQNIYVEVIFNFLKGSVSRV